MNNLAYDLLNKSVFINSLKLSNKNFKIEYTAIGAKIFMHSDPFDLEWSYYYDSYNCIIKKKTFNNFYLIFIKNNSMVFEENVSLEKDKILIK